jgi:hypothetical protein
MERKRKDDEGVRHRIECQRPSTILANAKDVKLGGQEEERSERGGGPIPEFSQSHRSKKPDQKARKPMTKAEAKIAERGERE